jgi:DNA-directed RNA polymerase subunit RPC12/RpoP
VDRQIVLIPLVCVRCSTRIPAMAEETAWVCANCGQAMSLDEEHGLIPQLVYYSAEISPDTLGKPYWVSEGHVSLQRVSYGSDKGQREEALRFWSQPHRFFIPAYQASLEQLLAQGIQYLTRPPQFAGGDTPSGAAARFAPITLDIRDLKSAAEFLVVAIEAARPDKLKELTFDLKLSPPSLWILP